MTPAELRRLVEAVPEAHSLYGDHSGGWCGADGLCGRCRHKMRIVDALLATPLLLDAYEAVVWLGESHAAEKAAPREGSAIEGSAWDLASRRTEAVKVVLFRIADAIHAREGDSANDAD